MATGGTATWTGVGPEAVQLGDTWVFRRARLAYIRDGGAPDLFADFEVRDGVPECVSLRWECKPNGRGIRPVDIKFLRIDDLVEKAFRQHAHAGQRPRDSDEREHWRASGDIRAALSKRSRGPSREHLEQVAAIYRAHVDAHPTTAVAQLLGLSRRTAERRIQQAREADLLPPTTPGMKGA